VFYAPADVPYYVPSAVQVISRVISLAVVKSVTSIWPFDASNVVSVSEMSEVQVV
jgi:hypothetical protein